MHIWGKTILGGACIAVAVLTGCSHPAPPPPPPRIVSEATVGAHHTTINGWSECPKNEGTGRTIIQVHGPDDGQSAKLSGGVDESTGGVNWLELIDETNGIRLEANEGDLTATKTGQTFHIVSRPGYEETVDITVNCPS